MFVKGKVPNQTFNFYNDFWICINQSCGKIYWQGSHWKKINEVLIQAKKLTVNSKKEKQQNNDRS
jgi:uncharacterized protein with PIN domain